jgi:hypothetical protein
LEETLACSGRSLHTTRLTWGLQFFSAPPELSDAHTAVFYIMFHQTVYNISLHKGIYLTCTILGTIKKIVIQIVLGFCG